MTTPNRPVVAGRTGAVADATLAARPLPTAQHRAVANLLSDHRRQIRAAERRVREAEAELATAKKALQEATEAAAGLESLLDLLDRQP